MKTIREIELKKFEKSNDNHAYVGCIIMTHDNKILLQEIINPRPFFAAGSIVTFGGKIEFEETPNQALVRELKEELGAKVNIEDAIYLGAITEQATNYSELIYSYFWHDQSDSITGCYEDKAKFFDNIQEVLNNNNVTDDVRWMLNKYQKPQFI